MGLPNDLANLGVECGYMRYVVQLEPILAAMGARGMPVLPERHAEVAAELKRRLNETDRAMQARIPDEIRPFVPKGGYRKLPKDFAAGVGRGFDENASPSGVSEGQSFAESRRCQQPTFPTPDGRDSVVAQRGDKNLKGVRLSADAADESPRSTFMLRRFDDGEDRWTHLLPWKPSRAGLIRYMRHRGHAVPRDWKTGKETTLESELVRLAKLTHDPLYEVAREYRQIQTILRNHVANWTPGADGRVHPTWYYDTGTGQLAARRPNLQNAPKHGIELKRELADMFRSMVVAKPGHTLLEFDYRSFHAQTLAFEAKDKDYLRLAKLDIHSFLTAHFIHYAERDKLLLLGDGELADRLREIRNEHSFVRDFKAKRAVLGYGFGMGYRKLYMLNRDSFDSPAEAKRLLDTLNGLFPKVAKWRDEVRARAHEQGYLLSRFGCIRWFWEVFKWSDGKWVSGGEGSEAAVAFLPANDAFCHIKEAMLRLDNAGYAEGVIEMEAGSQLKQNSWLRSACLVNQMHDAFLFECPDAVVEEAIHYIRAEMERPSEVLVNEVAPKGLSVEVEVSRGRNWSKMKKAA